MSFVTLSDITKQYRMGDIIINANDKVSFDIEKGEFAIIVGPSGSGKTTVLNILGGMDTATSGSFYVDGSKISGYSRKELIDYRRYDIGFIFQFYNLIPNLTAKENIELSTQTVEDYIPAVEILEKVGLTDRINNFPAQLSGGEQQRVAIARALAKKPKLLLCDEPTGALDYNTGKMILKLLQDTCRSENMTVILVTHNTAICPMADRVIHMKSSKVSEIVVNEHPTPVEEIEWLAGKGNGYEKCNAEKCVCRDEENKKPFSFDIRYNRYRHRIFCGTSAERSCDEGIVGSLLQQDFPV